MKLNVSTLRPDATQSRLRAGRGALLVLTLASDDLSLALLSKLPCLQMSVRPSAEPLARDSALIFSVVIESWYIY